MQNRFRHNLCPVLSAIYKHEPREKTPVCILKNAFSPRSHSGPVSLSRLYLSTAKIASVPRRSVQSARRTTPSHPPTINSNPPRLQQTVISVCWLKQTKQQTPIAAKQLEVLPCGLCGFGWHAGPCRLVTDIVRYRVPRHGTPPRRPDLDVCTRGPQSLIRLKMGSKVVKIMGVKTFSLKIWTDN